MAACNTDNLISITNIIRIGIEGTGEEVQLYDRPQVQEAAHPQLHPLPKAQGLVAYRRL